MDIDIDKIVQKVILELNSVEKNNKFDVEISARHVHLSQSDLEYLFGENYTLTFNRELSQKGQFLSNERVRVIGSKSSISDVAILGPVRKQSQVELSLTDAFSIGIKPILRESGDISKSSPICISYKDKFLHLDEGAIIAKNHIHMNEEDSKRLNVKHGDKVKVCVESERKVIFDDVIIRVNPEFVLSMHIDFDEANACFCKKGTLGKILDY